MKPPLNFNQRKGQTLVEFALLLPVLVLALVMIFDLGRAVYYYSVIFNAAREGARYGIAYESAHPEPDVSKSDEEIANAVIPVVQDMALDLNLQPTDVVVVLTRDTNPLTPNFIRVGVTYRFTPATPLLASFLSGGQIELTTEAEMRTEY